MDSMKGASQINAQMDRLTDLLVNETINKEAYDRKFSQLQARRKEITVMQEEHQGGNEDFKNAITEMASLATRAPDVFKSSKTEVKRSLIASVFSNLELNGSKLEYTLREPFCSFQNVIEYKEWLGFCDDVRTYHHEDLSLLAQSIPSELLSIIGPD